jgi:hypothetical protein
VAYKVFFDGAPTVRLTKHELVPSKLVIPGSAWCGGRRGPGCPHWELAKAVAKANGLRVASVWLSTSGEYVAALSTRRTIGHGCYLPAAEVTFRVAKEESQGEK